MVQGFVPWDLIGKLFATHQGHQEGKQELAGPPESGHGPFFRGHR